MFYRVNVATELPPFRMMTLVESFPASSPKTVFKLPGATNVAQFYWIEVE
jgi:hypothetical protein